MQTERPSGKSPIATTVAALLREGADALACCDNPRLDAELLLCRALQRSRSWLLAWPDQHVSLHHAVQYRDAIAQRATGYPLAYMTGRREFWSLDLEVTAATLVPRPETELLVELALSVARQIETPRIADLGTGTGAVALALAAEMPAALICATDTSDEALAVAKRNADRLGFAHVTFLPGHWLAPLAGQRFDLIVSNPPYVVPDDPLLREGALRFEPRTALAGQGDGLDDAREIAAGAAALLRPGGSLLLEHGFDQGREMRRILRLAGWSQVTTWRDLAGIERVSGGLSEPARRT